MPLKQYYRIYFRANVAINAGHIKVSKMALMRQKHGEDGSETVLNKPPRHITNLLIIRRIWIK
jgi:hypothetical protein